MWLQFCCRLVGVGSVGLLAIAIIGQTRISCTAHFAGNIRKHRNIIWPMMAIANFSEVFLRKAWDIQNNLSFYRRLLVLPALQVS